MCRREGLSLVDYMSMCVASVLTRVQKTEFVFRGLCADMRREDGLFSKDHVLQSVQMRGFVSGIVLMCVPHMPTHNPLKTNHLCTHVNTHSSEANPLICTG